MDANIIIAALLGSRATLVILTSHNYYFYSPTFVITEIKKHKDEICELGKKSSFDFERDLNALCCFISLLYPHDYSSFLSYAKLLMKTRDIQDSAYIACALTINADFIWSNDKDFRVQSIVPVKTTTQFINENK